MDKSKTNTFQTKLDIFETEKEKNSSVLQEFPDVFSIMFKNKNAIKSHNKKKNYKNKYGK